MENLVRRRYKFIADPRDVRLGEVVREGGDADVVLVGAPWDGAVGTRPGSRYAPSKIRQCLYTQPFQGGFSVSDWGDVDVVVGDHEESWRRITHVCERALAACSELLLVGGDSTVSYCAFRALRGSVKGRLAYLSFDAHPDVRVVGRGLTSGQVVRWVREVDGGAAICVAGVRGHSNPPYVFGEAQALGVRVFGVDEVVDDGGGGFLRELEGLLAGCTLHLSINMDVVDPAYAPGVNSPSPGGLTSREIIALVRTLAQRFRPRIVDLVEYTPAYDVGDLGCALAGAILSSAIWVGRV